MVVPRKQPERRYRVDRRDVEIGAKHELEHTKNKAQARRIARQHLIHHPTYYDVLPVAEREMAAREINMKALPRKKKPRQQPQGNTPPGWNTVPWEGR